MVVLDLAVVTGAGPAVRDFGAGGVADVKEGQLEAVRCFAEFRGFRGKAQTQQMILIRRNQQGREAADLDVAFDHRVRGIGQVDDEEGIRLFIGDHVGLVLDIADGFDVLILCESDDTADLLHVFIKDEQVVDIHDLIAVPVFFALGGSGHLKSAIALVHAELVVHIAFHQGGILILHLAVRQGDLQDLGPGGHGSHRKRKVAGAAVGQGVLSRKGIGQGAVLL